MSVSSITYSDKSDISTSSVAATNKIVAADMNEIKSVVNNNATELSSALTTLSSITSQPGKVYKAYELYNGVSSGGTDGTVTLSDSSANYDYLEIYFRSNDGTDNIGSQKVYQPNGKKTFLLYWFLFDGSSGTNNTYAKIKKVNISNNSISVASYVEINVDGGNVSSNTNNLIYITKVIGYKEV